jgi:peptidoglycan/LPS O-acetylase OafA/YrhL
MTKIFKLKIDDRRIFGLDILRAFAILFVLLQHGSYLLPKKLKYYNHFIVIDGVTIFFVLSGFLIGGILIKTLERGPSKNIGFKTLLHFWKRRWYRTLPAYFFMLLLLCLIWYLNSDSTIKDVLILTHKYFIFSQNLISNHPWFFPEAWSLSVEEWFYLITPLLIFLLIIVFKISARKSTLLVAFVILLATTLIRLIKFENSPP